MAIARSRNGNVRVNYGGLFKLSYLSCLAENYTLHSQGYSFLLQRQKDYQSIISPSRCRRSSVGSQLPAMHIYYIIIWLYYLLHIVHAFHKCFSTITPSYLNLYFFIIVHINFILSVTLAWAKHALKRIINCVPNFQQALFVCRINLFY